MSFTSLLIHSVTIKHRVSGGTDRYNNSIEAYDAGVVSPARVQYLSTAGTFEDRERLLGRDLRQQWYEVFLPPEASVDSLCKLVWQGIELLVDGMPMMKYDGAGPHHWEVLAKEQEG